MITANTIDAIRYAANIEDVVGAFVTLKRSGTTLKACCPFHEEKTPSFTVSPAKGIFKCFGCGKGGDAIHFLREYKGMTYVDALRWLADRYKITVEETADNGKDTAAHDQRMAMRTTATILQAHFAMSPGEKESPGRQYWLDRGFTPATLDEFGIGYCDGKKPDHVPDADFAAIGAINEKGNLLFYKRSTIPIHDRRGHLVAWAGRTVEQKDGVAKYINSPQTEIYSKNTVLYNLHRAAPHIRNAGEVWIVEGYADAMAAHQMGICNVVALCGTALTDAHVDQLRKFNGDTPLRIVLALDNEITKPAEGDERTYKVQVAVAYFTAIEKLVALGEVVRMVYPRGRGRTSAKDIADLMQQGIDPATCEKKDVIQDYVERKLAEGEWAKNATAVEKADFQEHVARLLSRIKRESVRDIYIKSLCGLLELMPRKFSDLVAKYGDQSEKVAYDILNHEYIIVGDEFRHRIPDQDEKTGEISWQYKPIKKSTITDQFGQPFIRTIPRFAGIKIKPSHTNYQRIIQIDTEIGTYNFFNDYEPLKFKPKPFDLPAAFYDDPFGYDYTTIPEIRNVAKLFKHIFDQGKNVLGDDYLQIAWDWFAIMYLQPEQRLPAVGIVSKEEGTGKSTLINVMAKFFGQNATKIDASRIAAKFNSLMAGKVLAYCEETKDDRGQMENILKDLITGFEMVMERKNVDAEVIQAFCKFLLASNHPETFMKVGTATTRFFITQVVSIPEGEKVKNMEELCYLELPYLAYFLERRGIMVEWEDRLWFKPERYENDALKRLRQASKDVVEQNMENLIGELFLRCEITRPILLFSSLQLKELMIAYAGKLYENKTPNYFLNVATRDMGIKYNEQSVKREVLVPKGYHHAGWVNFETWEYEKKKIQGRFLQFPIWKFCTPQDIQENYSEDARNNLIIALANDAAELSKTYGNEPAEWLNSLTSNPRVPAQVGEDIPF